VRRDGREPLGCISIGDKPPLRAAALHASGNELR
jgi:hypothetical protein